MGEPDIIKVDDKLTVRKLQAAIHGQPDTRPVLLRIDGENFETKMIRHGLGGPAIDMEPSPYVVIELKKTEWNTPGH